MFEIKIGKIENNNTEWINMVKKSTQKQTKSKTDCSEDNLVWIGKRISDLQDDQRDLFNEENEIKLEFDYLEGTEIENKQKRLNEIRKENQDDQKEIDELSQDIINCGKKVDDIVNEALENYEDLQEIEDEEMEDWEDKNPPLPDKPESDIDRYYRNFGTYEGY